MTREDWQLLPPLSDEEFADLKASIARFGVQVPIEVDQRTGHILDGHHRDRAVQELRAEGVRVPDPPRAVRLFATDDQRIEYVLSLNLARRHLGGPQRRRLVSALRERGWSLRRIGGALGVHHETVRDDLARVGNPTPQTVEGADRKRYPATRPTIIVSSARDVARARAALGALGDDAPHKLLDVRKAEERARLAHLARLRTEHADDDRAVTGETWELRCGDFRDVLADVAAASVDAVVCDPPYPDQYLPLWSDLGALASRVLKPGRLLVAYCGHLRQPEVMGQLAEHLEYVWVGATLQWGRHTIMRRQRIWTRYRPWLIFSAGGYKPRSFIDDTLESDGNGEKSVTDHQWQQNLSPFRKIVSMVTAPGELVVDPFTGSGTTGAACLLEGRHFLGAEIDPGAFAMAHDRLHKVALEASRCNAN